MSTAQEVVKKDKRRKAAEARAAHYLERAGALKKEIIDVMTNVLKTAVIEADGWTVRVSQAKPVVYDDMALIAALTPAQRRLVTIESIDLNSLSGATRKQIIDSLDPRVRRAATTITLDYTKLSQAVQQGKVDPKLVSRYSEIKPKAPYISASGPKQVSS